MPFIGMGMLQSEVVPVWQRTWGTRRGGPEGGPGVGQTKAHFHFVGDLVALRTTALITSINCTDVRSSEVQPISANGTFRTGTLVDAQTEYHLCLARVSDVGAQPPPGTGGTWPTGFAWQRLVRLSLSSQINVPAGSAMMTGHGIYTNQGLGLRAGGRLARRDAL